MLLEVRGQVVWASGETLNSLFHRVRHSGTPDNHTRVIQTLMAVILFQTDTTKNLGQTVKCGVFGVQTYSSLGQWNG